MILWLFSLFGGVKLYENDHRTINFSFEMKKKLKMKASFGNLVIQFIDGHLIKFDKTNLSIREPHKIIASNNTTTLIAY